jgi:hypothetical protein
MHKFKAQVTKKSSSKQNGVESVTLFQERVVSRKIMPYYGRISQRNPRNSFLLLFFNSTTDFIVTPQ